MPSERNKQDMAGGIRNTHPGYILEHERPELNPHYETSKRKFKATITFCAVCSNGLCACNRYIVHVFVTCAEMIHKFVHNLEFGKRIYLSMHHFFTKQEIEYFLDKFTKDRTQILDVM